MFMMKELPMKMEAWEPYISKMTMDFHYNKHYRGYCDKLNELAVGTRFENMPLELVIKESFNNLEEDQTIYNNAAQMWNHEFFWHSLALGESDKQHIKEVIMADFASIDDFKVKFKQTALAQFGSGWCWLVKHKGKAEIMKTSNADGPLTLDGVEPLFCLDVWEHAYYIDYQNRRNDYIQAFLDKLLNF